MYDVIKNLVASQTKKDAKKEGLSFAIIQANPEMVTNIKRALSVEDRFFVKDVLGQITAFHIDQIEALAFMPNSEELIVVTCYEFLEHDGGTNNGREFAEEIWKVRPQAQVFIYEPHFKVTPNQISGGKIAGIIPSNPDDSTDHSALLNFIRFKMLEHAVQKLAPSK